MGTPQLFDDPEETGQTQEAAPEEQETEVTENEQPVAEEYQETPEPDEDIPEKLRGKSPAELAKMYTELEKTMGRQSGEVGELRKLVDSYIQSQTVAPAQAQPESTDQDDELDFYTDPKEAVRRAIESHPSIREAKELTQQQKQAAALAQLQAAHPDYQQVVQDPSFGKWVSGDKELSAMFIRADQHFDYSAANSLLNLWKQRTNAVQQTVQAEQQARRQAAKSASTGDTRSAPQQGVKKKVYRRADIIKLIQTDPDRYMSMQDDIMQAYAEGRVK